MEIIDDFLPAHHFMKLEDLFLGEFFPWYYNSYTRAPEDTGKENYRLVHTLFRDNGQASDWFHYIEPIWDKLQPKSIIRAKINLGPRDSEQRETGWHKDFDNPDVRTAVFYLNNNNGYTLLEDGTKIESVKNRFAWFPGPTDHTGVTHTDAQVRIVLNLNYTV